MALIPQPVLSIELFQSILEEVATHPIPSDQMNTRQHLNRLRNLTQCALVCRTFAHICRPHIFEHIHSIGISHRERKRLVCFDRYVTEHPEVLRFVRMLTINIERGRGPDAFAHKEQEVQHALSTLTAFPHLCYLDLNFEDWNTLQPDDDVGLRLGFLNAYVPMGRLRTLYIDQLPPNYVLQPHLIDLKVREAKSRQTLIMDPVTASSLARLEVSDTYPHVGYLHVECLDQFPNLTHLVLQLNGLYEDPPINPSANYAFDSSKLKHLSILPLAPFYRYCREKQQRYYHTRKVFQELEELQAYIEHLDYIPTFREMLHDTPSLRRLCVRLSTDLEMICLSDLELHKCFIDGSLKGITDLELDCGSIDDIEAYRNSIRGLNIFLTAAAGYNFLERVRISLRIDCSSIANVLRIAVPPFTDLNTVKDIVFNNAGYGALDWIELSLSFERPQDIPFSYGDNMLFTCPRSSVVLIRKGQLELVRLDLWKY